MLQPGERATWWYWRSGDISLWDSS